MSCMTQQKIPECSWSVIPACMPPTCRHEQMLTLHAHTASNMCVQFQTRLHAPMEHQTCLQPYKSLMPAGLIGNCLNFACQLQAISTTTTMYQQRHAPKAKAAAVGTQTPTAALVWGAHICAVIKPCTAYSPYMKAACLVNDLSATS